MMTNVSASDTTRLQFLPVENQPAAGIAPDPSNQRQLARGAARAMPTGIYRAPPAPAGVAPSTLPDTRQGLAGWLKNTLMLLLQKMLGMTAAHVERDPAVVQRDERRSAHAAETVYAAKVMLRNLPQFSLADGQLWQGRTTLTTRDLSNVLNNLYAYNAATVSAALYMLQHPEAFHCGEAMPVDPAVAL